MSGQSLSLCHWNLNGIAANNYIKISPLEAYNAVHNFDRIWISETFLDSDHPSDDHRLGLQGYAMIRSDYPSNTKRGGVCIYYKEHLPFVRRDDITILDECILGEIKVKNSKFLSHASTSLQNKQHMNQMLSFLGLNRPVVT